jgi:hypothetical protein
LLILRSRHKVDQLGTLRFLVRYRREPESALLACQLRENHGQANSDRGCIQRDSKQSWHVRILDAKPVQAGGNQGCPFGGICKLVTISGDDRFEATLHQLSEERDVIRRRESFLQRAPDDAWGGWPEWV